MRAGSVARGDRRVREARRRRARRRRTRSLFVGSSSIRLWDTAKSFPGLPTINRGFGGSQICDSTHFADVLVVKHQPRMIVFYAGDNDIDVRQERRAGARRLPGVRGEGAQVAARRRRSCSSRSSRASRGGSCATQMQEANRLIAADCEEDETLEFVDVWPAMLGDDGQPRKELFVDDGLHMNDAGYKVWTELLIPYLDPAAKKSNHDSTTGTTTEK